MANQEIMQLNTKFDQLASQFGQLNSRFDELTSFLVDHFGKVATKSDLAELSSELRTEMATKGELAALHTELMSEFGEVREIVTRIDRRSDEDIRAVMKDVEKIKTYLVKRGHHI